MASEYLHSYFRRMENNGVEKSHHAAKFAQGFTIYNLGCAFIFLRNADLLLSSPRHCFILPSYSKELSGNFAFKFSFSISQTQRKDNLILQPHLKQIGKE